MQIPSKFNAPAKCPHNWEAVSFVFETESYSGDIYPRLAIRQPDLNEGRVYFICVHCASHTYMTTSWIGYRLHGSEDANPRYIGVGEDGNTIPNPNHCGGYNRPAWEPKEDDES